MNLRLTRAAGKEAEGPRYLKKGRGGSGVKATSLHRVIAKVEAISLFDLFVPGLFLLSSQQGGLWSQAGRAQSRFHFLLAWQPMSSSEKCRS